MFKSIKSLVFLLVLIISACSAYAARETQSPSHHEWVSPPVRVMVENKTYHLGMIEDEEQKYLAVKSADGHIVRDAAILKKIFLVQHVYRLTQTESNDSLRLQQLDWSIAELQTTLSMSYLSDAVLFLRDISARALCEAILVALSGGTSVGKTVAEAAAISAAKAFLKDPVTYAKGVNYLTIQSALDALQRARKTIADDTRKGSFSYEKAKQVERDLVFGLSRANTSQVLQGQLYLTSGGAGDLVSQLKEVGATMSHQLLGKVKDAFKYKVIIDEAILGAKITNFLIQNCPAYAKYINDTQAGEKLLGYETSFYYRNEVEPAMRQWGAVDTKEDRKFTGFHLISTLRGHAEQVRAVAFSRNGRLLASSDWSTIRIWDVIATRCLKTIKPSKSIDIEAIIFSYEGDKIVSVDDEGVIGLWDANTGRCLKTFGTELPRDFESVCASVSPDGQHIILGGTPALQIYDLDMGECTDLIVGHTREIRSIALSPDGKSLVSASDDTLLKIWRKARKYGGIKQKVLSVRGGQLPMRILDCWDCVKIIEYSSNLTKRDRCHFVGFSADGNHIISASDREVQVWEMTSGKRVLRFQPSWRISTAAVSPVNKLLALADGTVGRIALYDLTTGRCLEVIESDGEGVNNLAFCPDGMRIASVHGDKTIRLWATENINHNVHLALSSTVRMESDAEPDRESTSSNKDILFPAENRDIQGFIDKSGKFIILWSAEYPCRPLRFQEGVGLITVGMGNRFVVAIDAFGEVLDRSLSPPFVSAVGAFSEGLAPAMVDRKWGYVDKTLKFVIEPRFHGAEGFQEGLAAINPDIFSPWGYIDKEGKIAIQPDFYYAGPFSEGLAVAVCEGAEAPGYGYIDKTGNFVIEPQFVWCGDFSEGVAAVVSLVRSGGNPVQRWGYIDKTGKVVVGPQFNKALEFSEGLAAVKVEGKWGYIDKSGSMVISPQFKEASSFAEGLGQIKIGGNYGYIDSTGRIVLEASLDRATEFHEGVAYIEAAHSKGYIDRNGKYFWKLVEMTESSRGPVDKRKVSITTITNLRRIGRALWMYAEDHDGKFPRNLQELIAEAKLPPEALESPGKPKGFDGPSYIYISGQTAKMQPGNILVYENPGFTGEEINVLFLDGHVEASKPAEFIRDLEATHKRLGKEIPDIKFENSP